MNNLDPSKTKLRREYREIRSKIPLAYRESAALSAANIFNSLDLLKRSQTIACYLPYKDEFDSSPLIETIWQNKKNCFLPVLAGDERSLIFVQYEYGDALHHNRFSILEPINTKRTIAPEDLDLVITPLIAFDRQGNRLGTGGGYYDRTFAFLKKHPSPIQLIGLAYAQQQAPHIPHDFWDIVLQDILTEKGLIRSK